MLMFGPQSISKGHLCVRGNVVVQPLVHNWDKVEAEVGSAKKRCHFLRILRLSEMAFTFESSGRTPFFKGVSVDVHLGNCKRTFDLGLCSSRRDNTSFRCRSCSSRSFPCTMMPSIMLMPPLMPVRIDERTFWNALGADDRPYGTRVHWQKL